MRDDRKYLFVIGAGASVAFSKDIGAKGNAGFPTGEGLLERLKDLKVRKNGIEDVKWIVDGLKKGLTLNRFSYIGIQGKSDYRAEGQKALSQFYQTFYPTPLILQKNYYEYDLNDVNDLIQYLEFIDKIKEKFDEQGKEFQTECNKYTTFTLCPDEILTSILSPHTTKSIDYFIENDLKHFLRPSLLDRHLK
jgi:hypothetical protein